MLNLVKELSKVKEVDISLEEGMLLLILQNGVLIHYYVQIEKVNRLLVEIIIAIVLGCIAGIVTGLENAQP